MRRSRFWRQLINSCRLPAYHLDFTTRISHLPANPGGKYVTKAFLIITRIRDGGDREILGAKITNNESEGFWIGFFDELKDRGLKGIELIVLDGHNGIFQAAVSSRFLGASWQMSQVHYNGSAEGHGYPDLQVGEEVDPRLDFMLS